MQAELLKTSDDDQMIQSVFFTHFRAVHWQGLQAELAVANAELDRLRVCFTSLRIVGSCVSGLILLQEVELAETNLLPCLASF